MTEFVKIGGAVFARDSILMVGMRENDKRIFVKTSFDSQDIEIQCKSGEEVMEAYKDALSKLIGD